MSSGVAVAGVDDVIPTFLSQPPPVPQPQHITGHVDLGISDHVGDAVHNAASHAMDSAMDQLHDMVMPAL
ncbi:hypothetical protein AB4212_48825, partial [Streptomyces sp. 2MCAF27]